MPKDHENNVALTSKSPSRPTESVIDCVATPVPSGGLSLTDPVTGKFVKGNPGKPHGTGAGPRIQGIFREWLEDIDASDPDKRTRLQTCMDKMHDIVKSGGKQSVAAFKLILDRTYGQAAPSDAELEAMSKAGFQVVVLPQVAMQPLPPELPTKPGKFLEGKRGGDD